jgi:hypothetical protein
MSMDIERTHVDPVASMENDVDFLRTVIAILVLHAGDVVELNQAAFAHIAGHTLLVVRGGVNGSCLHPPMVA